MEKSSPHKFIIAILMLSACARLNAQSAFNSGRDPVATFAPLVQRHAAKWVNAWKNLKGFDIWHFTSRDAMTFTDSVYDISPAEFTKVDSVLLIASPDSSEYLDIYSSRFRVETRDGKLIRKKSNDSSAPRPKLTVFNRGRKETRDIFLDRYNIWCDDAFWLDGHRFVVVGFFGRGEDVPFIWVIDMEKHTYHFFASKASYYPEKHGSFFYKKFPNISIEW